MDIKLAEEEVFNKMTEIIGWDNHMAVFQLNVEISLDGIEFFNESEELVKIQFDYWEAYDIDETHAGILFLRKNNRIIHISIFSHNLDTMIHRTELDLSRIDIQEEENFQTKSYSIGM